MADLYATDVNGNLYGYEVKKNLDIILKIMIKNKNYLYYHF